MDFQLTTLDLGGFSNVTEIGTGFLYGCSSLTSLGLSSLNNVTRVHDYFLGSCSSLLLLDLTSFNNVTKVGASFLYGCSSLSTVKGLRPESKVRKVIELEKGLSGGLTFTLL